METSLFASKFLERLNKIDTDQVETFLTQLLKEKNIQRAIFDSLREGIILCDRKNRVEFVNEPVFGLLGLGGKKSVVGEKLQKILRSKKLQEFVELYIENPQPIENNEVVVKTPKPRVYSISVIPLGEGDEKVPPHSLWIIQDQTEMHRRAAEKQQLESMDSMATLTAGIAHEIKNPLNSLNIHAQMIKKASIDLPGMIDEKEQELLEQTLSRTQHSSGVLIEEIARLAKIVDQFISAVRPKKPDFKPTNLNELLHQIFVLLEPECSERHIRLSEDYDPVIPKLNIDAHQVQQALLNITKNAMEAIEKPEGQITIRSLLKTDFVLIEIEDNGCGIPEKDRVKIFEPYHSTKFSGTGLGLMVVYQIINAHRGAIGLDSIEGDGTVFRIALPLDEKPVRMLGTGESGDEIRIDELLSGEIPKPDQHEN